MSISKPPRYAVGKGRPPKATRWKLGQSGNPNGRPKGSKGLLTILREALDRKVSVEINRKARKITTREAMVLRMIQNALKGDLKTLSYLLAFEPEIERRAKSKVSDQEITDNTSDQEAAALWMATMDEEDLTLDDY